MGFVCLLILHNFEKNHFWGTKFKLIITWFESGKEGLTLKDNLFRGCFCNLLLKLFLSKYVLLTDGYGKFDCSRQSAIFINKVSGISLLMMIYVGSIKKEILKRNIEKNKSQRINHILIRKKAQLTYVMTIDLRFFGCKKLLGFLKNEF